LNAERNVGRSYWRAKVEGLRPELFEDLRFEDRLTADVRGLNADFLLALLSALVFTTD
jgi:hypothetical protein